MGHASSTVPRFHWIDLPTLGLGTFAGIFWMMYAFLPLLARPVAWWQYAVEPAPGAAILLLVQLARRHPVPYGSGLIALGLTPWFVAWQSRWDIRLAFGLPLILVGIGFLLGRRRFQA